MRIDELHKFSNGTLNDVWSALDHTLKRIWIKYLPQTIWREVDRERAGAMIQVIDQQLKNKRIMRSLETFIGIIPVLFKYSHEDENLLEPPYQQAHVMRMASAAAKPCQGDSLEFYLITCSIYTDQRGTVVIATIFDEVTKILSSISVDYH
ncbi:hypothetical protein Tco_0697730 [Tanacetum coccineum]